MSILGGLTQGAGGPTLAVGHVIIMGLSILILIQMSVLLLDQVGSDLRSSSHKRLQTHAQNLGSELNIEESAIYFMYPFKTSLFIMFFTTLFYFFVGLIGIAAVATRIVPVLVALVVCHFVVFGIHFYYTATIYVPAVQDGSFRPQMKESIRKEYAGPFGTDYDTLFWNVIMLNHDCCGVFSHRDFETVDKWNRTIGVEDKPVSMEMPPACCWQSEKLKTYDYLSECTNNSGNYNNKYMGCYEHIWTLLANAFFKTGSIFIIPISLAVQAIMMPTMIGMILQRQFLEKYHNN